MNQARRSGDLVMAQRGGPSWTGMNCCIPLVSAFPGVTSYTVAVNRLGVLEASKHPLDLIWPIEEALKSYKAHGQVCWGLRSKNLSNAAYARFQDHVKQHVAPPAAKRARKWGNCNRERSNWSRLSVMASMLDPE